MPSSLYLGFVVVLLLAGTVSCENTENCPAGCDCSKKEHLTCRDMTSFPESLASSAEIVSMYLSNFSVIPSNAFSSLPNMKILDMYSVNIGTIESCAFLNLHNMSRITIYNADIGTIKKGAFRSLVYDGYFSIYMSNIGTVESYAFTEVANTKSFTIFNSNITTIQPRAFYKFSKLSKFSLYSSNITHIKSGAFDEFHGIQTFSLLENFVERLECNTVEKLSRDLHESFSFSRILLRCDCNIKWLILQVNVKHEISLSTTLCKEPITLDGAPLKGLHASDVCKEGTQAEETCPSLPPEDPPRCAKERVTRHDHHDGHDHDHAHSGCTGTWKDFSTVVVFVCMLLVTCLSGI